MKLPKQTPNVDRNLGLAGAVGTGNVHASIDWGSLLSTAAHTAAKFALPYIQNFANG